VRPRRSPITPITTPAIANAISSQPHHGTPPLLDSFPVVVVGVVTCTVV
jgi:hypothetical protein